MTAHGFELTDPEAARAEARRQRRLITNCRGCGAHTRNEDELCDLCDECGACRGSGEVYVVEQQPDYCGAMVRDCEICGGTGLLVIGGGAGVVR